MLLDQYTPDVICKSMGLVGFIEPDWSVPTIRLLLKPSFAPEVCITIASLENATALSVVALTEQLWSRVVPQQLPAWSENVTLPASIFAETEAGFTETFQAAQIKDVVWWCDGMGIASCFATPTKTNQFDCHASKSGVTPFVSRLIKLAWESCKGAGVRNSLAYCASHIDEKYPLEPTAPMPEVSRIVILGNAEERTEFFEKLKE